MRTRLSISLIGIFLTLFAFVSAFAADEINLADFPVATMASGGSHGYIKPLTIYKFSNVDTVRTGDTVRYTIRLQSMCGQDLKDVKIIDQLPQGIEYIIGTADNGGTYSAQGRTLRWKIDKLRAGKKLDIHFKVIVVGEYEDTTKIKNTACIDDKNHCYCDEDKIVVLPTPSNKPALDLDKTASLDSAAVGDTIVYTIDVKSVGQATAKSVRVADAIPPSTSYLPGSISAGGRFDDDANEVVWFFDSIAAGDHRLVSFSVVVEADAVVGSEIMNFARYEAPFDRCFSDTTTTIVVIDPSKINLAINIAVDSTVAAPGSQISYTIGVANNSPSYIPITNLLVTAPIPPFTTLVPGSISDAGVYNPDSNRVEWIIPALDSGQSIDLHYSVEIDSTAPHGTEIVNHAEIKTPVAVISNDVTTLVQVPVHGPTLGIQKSVDKTSAYAGDTLTYSILVSNLDSITALDLIVADTVSENLTYVPGSASLGGVYVAAARSITWMPGSLAGYDTLVLSFSAVIDTGLAPGALIKNVAYLISPDTGSTDTTIVVVVPDTAKKPDLIISKSVDPTQATTNDTLTYTVVVQNVGDTIAFDVEIVDTVPSATTLVNGSITENGQYSDASREIRWIIPSIDTGASATVVFKSTIDSLVAPGTLIQNIAYLISPDTGTTDTTIVVVVPDTAKIPDLTISKTADPSQATVKDTLTFTITVANVGDTAAFGVAVVDTVPTSTFLIDGSITGGGIYDDLSRAINWQIPVLEVGDSLQLLFRTTIDSLTQVGTEIRNIAYLISPDTGSTDTTIVVVVPDTSKHAELDISKSVSAAQAISGDTLTYFISVANSGDTAAFGLVIADTVPNATTLVDGSIIPDAAYDQTTGGILWNIASLPAGGTLQLSFMTIVDSGLAIGTEIRNIAYLISPDTGSTDTTITVVVPDTTKHAILDISKHVDQAQAISGDTLAYTIVVNNSGDTAAFGLVIADTVPNATTLVNGSIAPDGTYNSISQEILWNIPSLGAGDSLLLNFLTVVDTGLAIGTEIRNIAYLISPDTGSTDTTITVIVPDTSKHPELTIEKSVSPTEASAGDTLIYTIAVGNIGDTAAFNVEVVDTVPANTELIGGTVTAGGAYNSQSREIRWLIPVVDTQQTAVVSFAVEIDPLVGDSGRIANVAAIVVPDTIPTDTIITTIIPDTVGLNLVISIAVDSAEASPTSILTYTVTLDNLSPIDVTARNITAIIPIPNLTSFVNGSIQGSGTYNAAQNRIDWSVDSLIPGGITAARQAVQLVFQAAIDLNAPIGNQVVANARTLTPVQRISNDAITLIKKRTASPDDFSFVKSVDKTLASPGDTLRFTLIVGNVSDSTIDSVRVSDQVPTGTALIAGSITHGGTFNSGNSTVNWDLGSLAPAAADTLAFSVRVNTDLGNGSVVTNQAFVTTPTLVPSNVTNTTIATPGEFVISKTANRVEVTSGDTVIYTIAFTNQGAIARNNVVITDTLDTRLTYVAGSATSSGMYNSTNRTLTWNFASIAGDATGAVQFRAIVIDGIPNGTQIGNVALINGSNLPLDTTTPSVITVRFPELSMRKTASPSVAVPGDTVTYTIVTHNTGLGNVTAAFIEDDLPTGFTYVQGTARRDTTAVTVNGTDPIRITVGTLLASDSAVITYRVAIDQSVAPNAYYTNLALFRGLNISNDTVTAGPASADVAVGRPNIQIRKSVNATTARVGSIVMYTITIQNNSDIDANQVVVVDKFPGGFFYKQGSSRLDGDIIDDPTGDNPYRWSIGTVAANESVVLTYSVVIGPSAGTGRTTNLAWVETEIGTTPFTSPASGAELVVIGDKFLGSIRGKVVVDCDGDGKPDIDTVPVGARLYLDDGQVSQVNKKGMFYFSTVRAVDHVVALDERSMPGFRIADGEQASVFVTVHEMGESYILFRVCLAGPSVSVKKKAAVVPQAEITKTARINRSQMTDSTGVMIDYTLSLTTSGGNDPTLLKIVDSLPPETRIIMNETESGAVLEKGVVVYETSVTGQQDSKSVFYSLEDLAPGTRRTITNKAYVEGDRAPFAEQFTPEFATAPVEVSVGPFGMTPPKDISIDVVGAQFETSLAKLKPEAAPVLKSVADSIAKYAQADVRIEGHADVRPIHTKEFPSNWELSTARAKSVRDWFIEQAGVDSSRMSFEGFAATRPRDPARNLEAYAKNRRVEIFLKARTGPKVDLSLVKDSIWTSSMPIDLEPVTWSDSNLVTPVPRAGISRTVWTIVITIKNDGPGVADDLRLLDILPLGVEVLSGSVSLNGAAMADPQVVGKLMTIGIGKLDEKETAEIQYKIAAPAGTEVSGGGAATVTIPDPNSGSKDIRSNAVQIRVDKTLR